jgi:hypothetical protein
MFKVILVKLLSKKSVKTNFGSIFYVLMVVVDSRNSATCFDRSSGCVYKENFYEYFSKIYLKN